MSPLLNQRSLKAPDNVVPGLWKYICLISGPVVQGPRGIPILLGAQILPSNAD